MLVAELLRCCIYVGALAASTLGAQASANDIAEADQQRIEAALASLQPQRPGVVDAYVVVAALDTDPVFGREAREAGRVLARRFDAEDRTVVLAEGEGQHKAGAAGTPQHLALAIGRAASLMDRKEDVLVLYTTSHGTPRAGLDYKDAARGTGVLTPTQLAAMFGQHGLENRLIILQACYSGQFVPLLASPKTVIATAASAATPSFGCSPGNDWTFFGHALVNQAMRKPDTFARQFRRAFVTIYGWEKKLGIAPSNPQISIGRDTASWLAALDAHAARSEGSPVGKSPAELAQ